MSDSFHTTRRSDVTINVCCLGSIPCSVLHFVHSHVGEYNGFLFVFLFWVSRCCCVRLDTSKKQRSSECVIRTCPRVSSSYLPVKHKMGLALVLTPDASQPGLHHNTRHSVPHHRTTPPPRSLIRSWWHQVEIVYYESIKRELNKRLIFECRCVCHGFYYDRIGKRQCDARLKAKAEGSKLYLKLFIMSR